MEEHLKFYMESIEDRIEDGLSEEEAVSAVGDITNIAEQIVADIPVTKIAIKKLKPKRKLKTWEIILLVLGSPLWLSLLIAAIAVIFSVYISIWAVIVSLWVVFASFAACAFAGAVIALVLCIEGNGVAGMAYLGAGIVCTGLSILFFIGCKAMTKGIARFTKKAALRLKSVLRIRRECNE